MDIRPAHANDLPAIENLLGHAALPFEDCKNHIDEFFVVCQEQTPIAVICLERCGEAALLRSLVVDQPFFNHRIGTQLVRHVIQVATAESRSSIYLLCEQAESYFINFGFQTIARHLAPLVIQQTAQFSTLCPESATLMRLEL